MSTPKRKQNPLRELRKFAAALGWSPLKRYRHRLPPLVAGSGPKLVTWYECHPCGDDRKDFFLQINEYPIGNCRTYSVSVHALRYRLHSGWFVFRIPRGAWNANKRFAELCNRLGRVNFATPEARREYRLRYPDSAGYTWAKLRSEGPPFPER